MRKWDNQLRRFIEVRPSQADLFRRPTPRPAPTEHTAAGELWMNLQHEMAAPADPGASSDAPERAPPSNSPLLRAGGGVCPQCRVRYVDSYLDVTAWQRVNRGVFVDFARAEDFEAAKREHAQLLLERGAAPCKWGCGQALVGGVQQ